MLGFAAWRLLLRGGGIYPFCGVALAVTGAVLVGPLLAIVAAAPTGSLFYPRGQHRREPQYSGAIGRRMRGHYDDAIQEYERIASEFPQELLPHVAMLEIAVVDLQDAERGEAIVRRGLQTLQHPSSRLELLRLLHRYKEKTRVVAAEPALPCDVDTTVHSARLDLVPMPAAFLRASLRGERYQMRKILPLQIPTDWPDNRPVIELRLRQLEEEAEQEVWLLRAIVLRASGTMIGHIGFHGPPGAPSLAQIAPNGAELGYTIFPPWQRQGYAFEACQALMAWARRWHGVRDFVASVSPTNQASLALATKLGFRKVGSHLDPIDGEEEILVRSEPT